MQQWEYKYDTSMKTEYLNELGAQGWDLCAWTPGRMIFKRPIGPDWKARCEAAEAYIKAIAFDPIKLSTTVGQVRAYEAWKELKNKT